MGQCPTWEAACGGLCVSFVVGTRKEQGGLLGQRRSSDAGSLVRLCGLVLPRLVGWEVASGGSKIVASVRGGWELQRGRAKEKLLPEADVKMGLSCSSGRVSSVTPADANVQRFPGALLPTQLTDSCQSKRFLTFL